MSKHEENSQYWSGVLETVDLVSNLINIIRDKTDCTSILEEYLIEIHQKSQKKSGGVARTSKLSEELEIEFMDTYIRWSAVSDTIGLIQGLIDYKESEFTISEVEELISRIKTKAEQKLGREPSLAEELGIQLGEKSPEPALISEEPKYDEIPAPQLEIKEVLEEKVEESIESVPPPVSDEISMTPAPVEDINADDSPVEEPVFEEPAVELADETAPTEGIFAAEAPVSPPIVEDATFEEKPIESFEEVSISIEDLVPPPSFADEIPDEGTISEEALVESFEEMSAVEDLVPPPSFADDDSADEVSISTAPTIEAEEIEPPSSPTSEDFDLGEEDGPMDSVLSSALSELSSIGESREFEPESTESTENFEEITEDFEEKKPSSLGELLTVTEQTLYDEKPASTPEISSPPPTSSESTPSEEEVEYDLSRFDTADDQEPFPPSAPITIEKESQEEEPVAKEAPSIEIGPSDDIASELLAILSRQTAAEEIVAPDEEGDSENLSHLLAALIADESEKPVEPSPTEISEPQVQRPSPQAPPREKPPVESVPPGVPPSSSDPPSLSDELLADDTEDELLSLSLRTALKMLQNDEEEE